MVDGRTTTDDNGQRTDAAYLYYKLTNEPKDSGALKMVLILEVLFITPTSSTIKQKSGQK